jgi:hypothetical protein
MASATFIFKEDHTVEVTSKARSYLFEMFKQQFANSTWKIEKGIIKILDKKNPTTFMEIKKRKENNKTYFLLVDSGFELDVEKQ